MATTTRGVEKFYQETLVNYLVSMARTVEGVITRAIQALLRFRRAVVAGRNRLDVRERRPVRQFLFRQVDIELREQRWRRANHFDCVLRGDAGLLAVGRGEEKVVALFAVGAGQVQSECGKER